MIKLGSLHCQKLLRMHSITMRESSSISGKLTPTIKICPVTVPKIQTIKLKNNSPKRIKTKNQSMKNDPIIFLVNYQMSWNKAKILKPS